MIRLILVLLIIALILAIRYLPWWAVALVFVGLVFVLPLLAKFALKSLFLTPFKLKGKVLRGATAVVHSVEPTAPPEPEPREADAEEIDAGEGEAEDLEYFLVDATITPLP